MLYSIKKTFNENNQQTSYYPSLKPHQKFALVAVGFCETIPLALSLIAYFGVFGKLSPTANKALLGSVASASGLLLLIEAGRFLKLKNSQNGPLVGTRQSLQNFEKTQITVTYNGETKPYFQLLKNGKPITVDSSGTALLLDAANNLYLYRIGIEDESTKKFDTTVCLRQLEKEDVLYLKEGFYRIIRFHIGDPANLELNPMYHTKVTLSRLGFIDELSLDE